MAGDAAVAAAKSRFKKPGVENSLDQFLSACGGRRTVPRGGKGVFFEQNRLFVAVEVGDAPGAFGQMLLELSAGSSGGRFPKRIRRGTQ